MELTSLFKLKRQSSDCHSTRIWINEENERETAAHNRNTNVKINVSCDKDKPLYNTLKEAYSSTRGWKDGGIDGMKVHPFRARER